MNILFLALSLQATPVSLGHWNITTQRDAISDNTEVSAILSGEGGTLSILCNRSDGFVLTVQPAEFLGGPISRYELRDTWVRIDSQPVWHDSWKYVDGYAAPYTNGDMRRLLGQMQTASRMTVRLTRYDNATVDVAFDLADTTAALAQVRQFCRI